MMPVGLKERQSEKRSARTSLISKGPNLEKTTVPLENSISLENLNLA